MMRHRFIACILLMLLFFSGCTARGKPANDWLLEQNVACSDLEQASISISDLFSLYFIGAIEPSDFGNELNLLITQLKISQAQYLETQQEIEPASHSYASKCGQEALDSAYDITLEFIGDTNSGELEDKEALAYRYLEWRDSFITEIATYITAKSFIEENKGGAQ